MTVDESQTSLDEVSTNQRIFFIVASYYLLHVRFTDEFIFFFAKGKEIKLLTSGDRKPVLRCGYKNIERKRLFSINTTSIMRTNTTFHEK